MLIVSEIFDIGIIAMNDVGEEKSAHYNLLAGPSVITIGNGFKGKTSENRRYEYLDLKMAENCIFGIVSAESFCEQHPKIVVEMSLKK